MKYNPHTKVAKNSLTSDKGGVVWIAKTSPQSKSYCFDPEPHFQYFGEYCKTPEFKKDLEETNLTETMSLQWSPDLFRDKKNCQGWTETTVDKLKGWEGFKL